MDQDCDSFIIRVVFYHFSFNRNHVDVSNKVMKLLVNYDLAGIISCKGQHYFVDRLKKISKVEQILAHYSAEPPSILKGMRQMFNSGALCGTGRIIVYPVDQGFEHGPDASFAMNAPAYDPHYHIEMAIDAGFSAYAAPIGMISAVASRYAGEIPLILKINSGNSLLKSAEPNQAVTASVMSALRLGCSGIGLTIYPGSHNAKSMIEFASSVISEARRFGLFTVVWAYPRGGDIAKEDEAALDVVCYATHIAAMIGAHVIKVKIPEAKIREQNRSLYSTDAVTSKSMRVQSVMRAGFDGKRVVLFSGGARKGADTIVDDIRAIKNGGGTGSIMGRNIFQRDRNDALNIMRDVISVYKNEDDSSA